MNDLRYVKEYYAAKYPIIKLLVALIDDQDYEWLMIDASHCKVHPHASGLEAEIKA